MHTPGPWAISDDGTIESKHHGLIGHLMTASEADRKLIAAAPSLLFALREAQAYLDGEDVSRYAIEAVIRSAIQFATKE